MKFRGALLIAALAAGAAVMVPTRWASAQQSADDPRMAETRERITRGETLYEAGDFDGALVEFQRAYELLEGNPLQYLATYNIGRCYERMFRYDQAMQFYRLYLQQAGPDAEDRAEVEAKIELLEGLLATLHIQVNMGGYEVWVDERSLGQDLTEVMVPGGSHVVEIRAPGYVDARQQVNAPARSEQTLTFELEALAEEFEGLNQAYFWVSAGLAVATVAVGAVFGGLAIGESNDVQDRADDPIEGWLVTQGDLDHISDLALTADLLYGGAALFAVAAVVLAFFTNWGGDEDETEATPAAARLHLSPMVAGNTGGLLLGGRF